jgi:hypothetical protein
VLARFDGQYDTFMPHTTLLYSYALNPSLGPGTYTFAGSFGAPEAPGDFSWTFTVGPNQVARSRAHHAPGVPATQQWWLRLLIILPLIVLGLLLLLLAFRRNRCTHCRRHRLRSLIAVRDYLEVAGCSACRDMARSREPVRLCRDCYASHVKGGVLVSQSPALR